MPNNPGDSSISDGKFAFVSSLRTESRAAQAPDFEEGSIRPFRMARIRAAAAA
jgi:hypothetical protein